MGLGYIFPISKSGLKALISFYSLRIKEIWP